MFEVANRGNITPNCIHAKDGFLMAPSVSSLLIFYFIFPPNESHWSRKSFPKSQRDECWYSLFSFKQLCYMISFCKNNKFTESSIQFLWWGKIPINLCRKYFLNFKKYDKKKHFIDPFLNNWVKILTIIQLSVLIMRHYYCLIIGNSCLISFTKYYKMIWKKKIRINGYTIKYVVQFRIEITF